MSKIRPCNSLSIIHSAGQSKNQLAIQTRRNNILKLSMNIVELVAKQYCLTEGGC